MNVKKKLLSTLAIPIAALMFYTPALAGSPKNSQESETKPKQEITETSEEESEKPLFDKFYDAFEPEFGRKFKTELKKEDQWVNFLIWRNQHNDPYFSYTQPNYEDPIEDEIKSAAEAAFASAFGEGLDKIELLDKLRRVAEGFTKLEFTKNKGEKTKMNNPLKVTEEDRVEDKIDKIKDQIDDYELAGEYTKAQRLKREKERLEDRLYKNRKFKLSLGMNLDIEDIDSLLSGEFKDQLYSKMQTRYGDVKLFTSLRYRELGVEIDRDITRDLHVELTSSYQDMERKINGELKEKSGYKSSLSLSNQFDETLSASISQTYDWDEENITSVGVSKIVRDDFTVGFSGDYGWGDNEYSAMIKVKIDF